MNDLTLIILVCIFIYLMCKTPKKRKQGYVYFIQDPDTKEIKIGLSNNPKRRLAELQKHDKGKNLKIIKQIYSNDMYKLEKYYHDKFKEYRLPPRKGDGGTEWFSKDIRRMI